MKISFTCFYFFYSYFSHKILKVTLIYINARHNFKFNFNSNSTNYNWIHGQTGPYLRRFLLLTTKITISSSFPRKSQDKIWSKKSNPKKKVRTHHNYWGMRGMDWISFIIFFSREYFNSLCVPIYIYIQCKRKFVGLSRRYGHIILFEKFKIIRWNQCWVCNFILWDKNLNFLKKFNLKYHIIIWDFLQ